MAELPKKLPQNYKKLQHPWSVAFEFDARNPKISYYLRMNTLQEAMAIDKKTGRPANPAEQFPLLQTMDHLENLKKSGQVGSEIECYNEFEKTAAQLLGSAEKLDNAMQYDRKIVKLYFTASILFDNMSIFQNYDGRHADKSKFVKWRSTYIANELKAGRIPDPPASDELGDDADELAALERELGALDASSSLQSQQQQQITPAPSINRSSKPTTTNQNITNPYPQFPTAGSSTSQPQNTSFAPVSQPTTQPLSQPVAQPRNVPQQQPQQTIFTGQYRSLEYSEQKEVKKMLDLVMDCLQYDDTAGAVACCQKAITFMQTGQK